MESKMQQLKQNDTKQEDPLYSNQTSILNVALKKRTREMYLQKMELTRLEEQLTRVKLLQEKAIIIANEKKMKHKETQELLEKHHNNFVQIITPYLESNLTKEIDAEISNRFKELNENIEELNKSLLDKIGKIKIYEAELNNIKSQIVLRKRQRNVIHSQLQKALQDIRHDQIEAEKMLNKLRSGNIR